MSTIDIDLIGIAYRAYERKDRIIALVARWIPLIQLTMANQPLVSDTITLLKEILPGVAPPSGYSVQWIQESLNKLGEHLDVDGEKGSETDAAVERFQAANGLVADGWVGVETGAMINAKANG
jgi:hypothetical protein